MKALFIANDPSLFDPASPVRERMQRYAASIGSLHILSSARGNDVAEYRHGVQEGGLVLQSIPGGKRWRLLGLLRAVRRLIKKEGIEIVSAQDPFEHGWVALAASRGTQAKLHIQVHTDFCSPWFTRRHVMRAADVHMPLLNSLRLRIADRVIPQADGIRAVSVRIQDSLVARYGNHLPPITVIPIATAVTLPAPTPLPAHSFSFSLITVSRLAPEKRIEDILHALARIHRTYPAVGLFVVGDGPSRRSLEARAKALGLGSHVHFLGWRQDALALMQSAQAYVQASAYEGYGLTLIEAALARLPIITTDVGIVGEVFVGYEDVLVAPPADPAALAVHIASLVEDLQARRMLSMNAERKAHTHLAGMEQQPLHIAADLAQVVARPRA